MITLDCWESLCFDQKCFWKVVVANFSLQLCLAQCACRGNNKETGTAGPECSNMFSGTGVPDIWWENEIINKNTQALSTTIQERYLWGECREQATRAQKVIEGWVFHVESSCLPLSTSFSLSNQVESQEITAGLDSGHGDNSRHDDNGGTAAECRHQLRAVEPVPARSRQPVPDRLLTLLGGELLPTLLLFNHKSKH